MDFPKKLLRAIKHGGSNNKVMSTLEESANLHLLFDKAGYSLLHYSTCYGNIEIMQYLLDKGCYVDSQTQDNVGRTPFMLAIYREKCDVVHTLLKAGADLDICNKENRSGLEIAFALQLPRAILRVIFCELLKKYPASEELAQKLIDAKCTLYHAVFSEDAEIVEYMIKRGAALESEDHSVGATVLHRAVGVGHLKIVEVLLQYGANVDAVNNVGATPIFYAYPGTATDDDEKTSVFQALVKRGASLTSCTRNGLFQIYFTLQLGNREAVRIILQSMTDFTIKDEHDGRTILHILTMNTKPGVVDELKLYIEKFDINGLDHQRNSPLASAIYAGNVEMVKFLLDQGALVHVDTFLYVYALTDPHLRSLHDECAEILLQNNADPQAVAVIDGWNITIFDVAINYRNFKRIKSAIAKLAILEKEGVTITQLIRSKIESHKPFEEYLKKYQRLLDQTIYGTVTVFKLLTASRLQLKNYLKNEDFVVKLMRIAHKQKLRSAYSYYYNIMKKRLTANFVYKTMREMAAGIICKLVDSHQLAKNTLLTEEIIDYLDDQDLLQLRQVYEDDL